MWYDDFQSLDLKKSLKLLDVDKSGNITSKLKNALTGSKQAYLEVEGSTLVMYLELIQAREWNRDTGACRCERYHDDLFQLCSNLRNYTRHVKTATV
jgi:hypothetical protein